MKRFWMAASVAALCAGSASFAQTNGLDPANLPPEGFDGREFVDSAGCSFLRSTFGGEVTWVPRYGPDRNPVCGQSPTDFSTIAAPAPEAAPEGAATAAESDQVAQSENAAAEPEAPRGRIEIVGAVADPVRRPDPSFLDKEPRVASVAPRRNAPRAAPKPRMPQADASGRHPSCPASSPYGQLVDTELGRKMVRCVTSPSLFLDEYVTTPARTVAHTPHAAVAASHGARVQVGSFAVSGNAQRLVARLQAAGLPAGSYRSRGLNVVTVGPFASGADARHALSHVRRLGFRDAFLR